MILKKIGMPTLIEFKSIEENVEFAKNNNIDFIELNMDLPYCLNIKKNELNKFDFEFTMHVSEKINIAELNENLRKAYLDEAIRQIKIGINNSINKFTIHINSGIYFTLPSKKIFLNEVYSDLYKIQFQKSSNILNNIAKENNISINFENTKIQPFTPIAIDIVKKTSHLGFTLDIGHNEKNDNKAYPLLKNKIKHIHMHDFDGKSDHLPLGNGKIIFKNYEEELKENYVVIEVKKKEDLIKSIDYLNK